MTSVEQPEILPLRADQFGVAQSTLGEAFRDDPLLHIVAPDAARRERIGEWFMGMVLTYGMRWGEVTTVRDGGAVAVWLPPGATDVSPVRMMKVGLLSVPFKAGTNGFLRFMRALSATEKFHKAVKGPHWYLMAIGTRPELQGSGLGSALIDEKLSAADELRLPCYLETATAGNVAFYSKRGFEITGQAEAYGFTLYGMVRPPK